MPYLKCLNCMHEWEGDKDSKCDWCGAGSWILEKEIPLEKLVNFHLGEPIDYQD